MKFARISEDKKILELVTHYNPFEEPAKSALPADWVFVEVHEGCDFSWIWDATRNAFVPPSVNWFYEQDKRQADAWFQSQIEELKARDDIAFHLWEAALLYREEVIDLMRQRRVKYDELAAKYTGVPHEKMLDEIAFSNKADLR